MRLIYADPGLVNQMGHHNTMCRNLAAALRARGCTVEILGAVNIEPMLSTELGAAAYFRASPHFVTDGDPYCGWLSGFFLGADMAHGDFARLSVTADDVIYLASGQAAHLMGLTRWLGSLTPQQRPAVIIDMVHPPGIMRAPGQGWLTVDPRVDAQAAFYRFTAHQIRAHGLSKLHFVCVAPDFAQAFSELLGQTVIHINTLPFARSVSAERRGRRPSTVAVLGYQVEHKGYHLVPEIAALVLHARPDTRFAIHNSKPQGMAQTQDQLRRMAAADARVTVHEGALNDAAFQAVPAATDLLLCPYNPDYYRAALSGVVAEGIASGVPLVVPGGTLMAETAIRNGCGVAFETFTVPSIARAVTAALDGIDGLAGAALREATRWAGAGRPAPLRQRHSRRGGALVPRRREALYRAHVGA